LTGSTCGSHVLPGLVDPQSLVNGYEKVTHRHLAVGILVNMSSEHVKLLVPGESEKGRKDLVYPVTPDFAELLPNVPGEHRSGFVFNPVAGRGMSRNVRTVSKGISRIGESAGVKNVQNPETGERESQAFYASAHDRRRAILGSDGLGACLRWF